jgi:lysophospholipase L1-like esterase
VTFPLFKKLPALAGLSILICALSFSCSHSTLPLEVPSPAPDMPVELSGPKNERFAALLEQAERVGNCAVLVIGDSIVEGMYKKYHDADIFAAGVQGAGVNDWLPRAPLLLELLKPERIIVALGVNDSRIRPDKLPEFFQSYAELCRILSADTPKLAVSTILPVRRGKGKRVQFGNRVNPAMIRNMNAGIKRIAAEGGYAVIDSHQKLADGSGMLPADFTFDGVHLSKSGYARWESLLFARSPLLKADGRRP